MISSVRSKSPNVRELRLGNSVTDLGFEEAASVASRKILGCHAHFLLNTPIFSLICARSCTEIINAYYDNTVSPIIRLS